MNIIKKIQKKQKRKKLVDEALDFAGLTEYAKKRPKRLAAPLFAKRPAQETLSADGG